MGQCGRSGDTLPRCDFLEGEWSAGSPQLSSLSESALAAGSHCGSAMSSTGSLNSVTKGNMNIKAWSFQPDPGHSDGQHWLQNSLLGWMRLCQACTAADFAGLLLLHLLPSQPWILINTLCANLCVSICLQRMQPETNGQERLQEKGTFEQNRTGGSSCVQKWDKRCPGKGRASAKALG